MRLAFVHRFKSRIEIRASYHADFIAELKATLPREARQWSAEEKIWIVSSDYREVALRLLEQYFIVKEIDKEQEEAEDDEQEQSQSDSSHTKSDSAYSVLYLLPTAPFALVKAAYRCLALLYHPDRGGNTEKMQTLNKAYEELQK